MADERSGRPRPRAETDIGLVHVTGRMTWRQCRVMYEYSEQGLTSVKEFTRPDSPLIFGTFMHEILALYYTEGRGQVLSFPEREEFNTRWDGRLSEEMITLAESVMSGYNKTYQGDLDWQIVGVEQELSWEIAPGQFLIGRLDLIVRDGRGDLWVVDHKTYKTLVGPDELEWDDQMTAYIYLARKNGFPVRGAILNQIRKKIPDTPKILSSGKVSRDTYIDTTWEIYRDFLLEKGFDPDDYRDMEQKLASREFFRRVKVVRTKQNLERFEEHTRAEIQEILNPLTPRYPNYGRNCTYCDYATLCHAELEGGDVESLKRVLYRRTNREGEIIEWEN